MRSIVIGMSPLDTVDATAQSGLGPVKDALEGDGPVVGSLVVDHVKDVHDPELVGDRAEPGRVAAHGGAVRPVAPRAVTFIGVPPLPR